MVYPAVVVGILSMNMALRQLQSIRLIEVGIDMEKTWTCSSWVILFIFICCSLYLLGADIYYVLRHGVWPEHGSILYWMESSSEEPIFVEWQGIRNILDSIPHIPFIEVFILGFIVSWFINLIYHDAKRKELEAKKE